MDNQIDMELYFKAAAMIAKGNKQSAKCKRRCRKCGEPFGSKQGSRLCDDCKLQNSRLGKMASDIL